METNNNSYPLKIHPKLFALYIGMGSMIMLFSSLCSALLVKRGDTVHWEHVTVPSMFLFSTIVIILSSIFLHFSFSNYIAQKVKKSYYLAIFACLLGVCFCLMQYLGWQQLVFNKILLNGNPSGSFLYVISGFHAFHYIFGILFLFYFLVKINRLKNNFDASLVLGFNILVQYWHFIGIVWVLLYFFFKYVIYK